jgi:hypothetical protein
MYDPPDFFMNDTGVFYTTKGYCGNGPGDFLVPGPSFKTYLEARTGSVGTSRI